MSSAGYREWEIWKNCTFFDLEQEINGHYLMIIPPFLMAEQSVKFIFEKIEQIRRRELKIENRLLPYLSMSYCPYGFLNLQKHETLKTSSDINKKIKEIIQDLEAISFCLDFPLHCCEIQYIIPEGSPKSGTVFVAKRKNIGRGVGFEIQERGIAGQKIQVDYDDILSKLISKDIDPQFKVATNYYLNGLLLLSLEDQYPGLIDAAFMQFYQGCEILAGSHRIIKAKKNIAKINDPRSKDLQIIAHHVWQVRHNYFGHGNLQNHILANSDFISSYNIAKQVLVARWLCRYLLDLKTKSQTLLVREIRYYHHDTSEEFRGTILELENSFKVDYSEREVDIFNNMGVKISDYTIQN
ncbi:MAG: hypothetical protein PHV39_01895 [Methanomicrobium sp.]|nr:hypothetical protein [Methanomicrobium sp.]